MKRTLPLLILLFFAQAALSQISLFDVLHPDSITHVRIETNFKKVIRGKMNPVYQKGSFQFLSGPLSGNEYAIQVKGRGNIRKEVCFFPPLKIKFSKSDIQFHKLKWVNICRSSKDMEGVLFKEYLSYKLYQTLTDKSFDVRLFHVEIYEPGKDEAYLSCYAFMIEPMKRLVERTVTKEYSPRVMRARVLDRYYYPLANVFEYLIGNTDWNIANAHNLKFLRTSELPGVVPVPYDFDYSGFVNAGYAVPHESLPIQHVRERYNKGHCVTQEELDIIAKVVLDKKTEMLQVIESFHLMEEKNRKRLLNYLEAGFEELENEKLRTRIFMKNCKQFED
jgi:hypothetical protein